MSTGMTSYFPRLESASATFFPDNRETSRSLEVPPIKTAIRFMFLIIPYVVI